MRPRQSGFSLLEVLVAFVILSLSLGVIMRLFSTSLRNIATAEQRTHAVVVAESALAGLGVEVPLGEGQTGGEDGQGYRWQALVSRHADAAAVLDNPAAPLLYRIELSVTREEDVERKPVLTLTTLRMGPKP
jgi:general secretion pathway protein I